VRSLAVREDMEKLPSQEPGPCTLHVSEAAWTKSETEVLRRIAASPSLLSHAIEFALASAFPWATDHPFAQPVYVGINIARGEVGLDLHGKPGDVDLLVIPFRAEMLFLDRVIALEVKVVRPTLRNPGRNANTFGRSQVVGLLKDGFPFVGLLHIMIPEPSPPEAFWRIPMMASRLGPEGELVPTGELFDFDPSPLIAAGRQEGRILASALPGDVGYRVMAVGMSRDKQSFNSSTMGEERRPGRNPTTSLELCDRVADLLKRAPQKFTAMHWAGITPRASRP